MMWLIRLWIGVQVLFCASSLYAEGVDYCSISIRTTEQWQLTREYAKGRNLPVLLLFVGKSWCPWSEKMESEVFRNPSFIEGLQGKCLVARVQMPAKIDSEPAGIEIQDLMKAFAVQESPTIFLLSSQGHIIKTEGFSPLPAKDLSIYWNQCFLAYDQIDSCLEDISKMWGEKDLQIFYTQAKHLRLETLQAKILQRALAYAKEPFFYVEQYEKLSLQKKPKSADRLALRKKILQLDPHNNHHSQLHLAMIDFAEKQLDRKKKGKAHKIAAPLLDYIAQYGKSDTENIGRLEMILAQFFLSKGDYVAAKEYAQKAYARGGASEVQLEISQMLTYMQSLYEDSTY